ncbi:carnitine O-acyltransferase, putative [Ixodes scapularis]|uniref:Carnitine O-acyltransferase, putative n=1 Tax=Ixodes scapularis TaxID=6945 RepID=B7PGB4_IXOSC|nr:carnitine O-acyltransferase, putative [Ixodes scapularis]|eukprot:XP_002434236.1 carnitine O-acyltransferase, putative [Ixodes scapularis]
MHQFRRLFNTARIPNEGKDEIVNKFRVESEESVAGRSPTNLIVLQQGHIFSFEVVNEQGDVLTRKEIETQLERIDTACTQLGPSQGVGTLTAGDRDTWTACDNIDILCEVFTGYGKGFMKPVRVHPEAYLQLALQLAYYRLHNK